MISPRILIALICLTVLSGCAGCLPGQSRLDKDMAANTASAQAVPGSENVTTR
ncbi:MAG: hypothetical protein AB7F74_19875 [Parvibaculaceae bacterium]